MLIGGHRQAAVESYAARDPCRNTVRMVLFNY
jgi:hypothetical protein